MPSNSWSPNLTYLPAYLWLIQFELVSVGNNLFRFEQASIELYWLKGFLIFIKSIWSFETIIWSAKFIIHWKNLVNDSLDLSKNKYLKLSVLHAIVILIYYWITMGISLNAGINLNAILVCVFPPVALKLYQWENVIHFSRRSFRWTYSNLSPLMQDSLFSF